MGMDVYGVEPSNPKGEYFRNNVWWWRPLWDYVCNECPDVVTPEDARSGQYNDGHLIAKEKADAIARRLKTLCANGQVLDVEREYKQRMTSLPDEVCNLCGGTGKRTDMEVRNGCNKCSGTGKVRPSETSYPFEAENVLQFAEFAEASGGFRIA